MDVKQQIGVGVSITLGTVLILYLYNKISSTKPKPELSKARKILSKYKPRPTAEDIKADNEFQGREVRDHQVSKSGIVYHDIRYPEHNEITEKTEGEEKIEEAVIINKGEDINKGEEEQSPEEKLSDVYVSEEILVEPHLDVTIETMAVEKVHSSILLSSELTYEEEVPMVSEETSVVCASAPDSYESIDEEVEVNHSDSVEVETNLSDEFDDRILSDKDNNSTLNTANLSAQTTDKFTPSTVPSSVTSIVTSTETSSETSPVTSPETSSETSSGTSPVTSPETSSEISTVSSAVTSNGVCGGLPSVQDFVRNVVRAKDKVEVNRKRNDTEIIQQIFNIPSKAVGRIIGKQGSSIKGIQRTSGARLQFPGNRDRNATSQKLFVSGTLRQVEEAVAMLVSLMPADSVCHDLITWTPQVALSGDLKPVDLIENTVCIGRVTHVTSPDCVWIQICRGVTGTDYLTMLSTLTDNITETLGRKMYDLKSALIPLERIKEGTSCAVMLEGRGYRGTVMCPGTTDNQVHQVRLVDFGTPHSFTELFNLHSYFFTMPALAVQCSLAHISKMQGDPIWPEGAALFLEESLADCFVKVRVLELENGVLPKVELYTEPNQNSKSTKYVNRELVYDGYASWID